MVNLRWDPIKVQVGSQMAEYSNVLLKTLSDDDRVDERNDDIVGGDDDDDYDDDDDDVWATSAAI